jgi:hypothetical protein
VGKIRLAATVMLVLALSGAVFGFDTLVQDLAFTRARTELGFWGQDKYQPDEYAVALTGKTLKILLNESPRHPDYLALQASYAVWQAYWSKDMQLRDALGQQALTAQDLALLSRPAHRHSWLKMVEYASRTSSGETRLRTARLRLESLQLDER